MMHDPMEILLVEDNEDDIILTEEAFAVAKVMNVINNMRDGEVALAYLRQEGPYKDAVRPRLVLLDINMPKRTALRSSKRSR